MPTGYIKKVAKQKGKSVKSMEKKWERAKEIVKEKGDGENWGLVTHIFKKMVGSKKKETNEESLFFEYLDRVRK